MKPMLAATTDGAGLRYPLLASYKLDGIRCVVRDGVALSRTLKPIPNKYLQAYVHDHNMDGMDGELIVGSPTAPDCYRKTMSALMSIEGAPDFSFYVFDLHCSEERFIDRLARVQSLCNRTTSTDAYELLTHTYIADEAQLLELEQRALAAGYEGLILRDPEELYKYGRSTLREQGMLKLKRFEDGEAVVIGAVELRSNTNERRLNELGDMRRTSHKAGMVGMRTLGTLQVRDLKTGVVFEIGTGFTDSDRKALWGVHNAGGLLGQVTKYKYFAVGVKNSPRHPVFLGFRDIIDIGE